jgi:hypothetical protein
MLGDVQNLLVDNSTEANKTAEIIESLKMNATNTTTVIRSMYHFMIGLVGGLFGDKAPNTMACTSNFTRIANASMALYNHTLNALNATNNMN